MKFGYWEWAMNWKWDSMIGEMEYNDLRMREENIHHPWGANINGLSMTINWNKSIKTINKK